MTTINKDEFLLEDVLKEIKKDEVSLFKLLQQDNSLLKAKVEIDDQIQAIITSTDFLEYKGGIQLTLMSRLADLRRLEEALSKEKSKVTENISDLASRIRLNKSIVFDELTLNGSIKWDY